MIRRMTGKPTDEIDERDFIDSPVFKLLLAANLLARPFIEKIGPEKDLTLPEWRCLVALQAKGELSNTEVAELTGLDPMSVSRALDRLQRNDRVERTRDPDDGRRQLNRMTASGRAVYRAVVKLARQRQEAMVRGLAEKEVLLFDDMLGRIIGRLRETG
jgi:DNA-binding MarR family transcriptional regulator